ncbi:VQ motif-containing protein 4-like [Curcuma longa]|uniref:VQ motif-containing protein 4-like n=1 Tax=Curcuma longa TaxID=136217 RepID=UPI003D9E8E24
MCYKIQTKWNRFPWSQKHDTRSTSKSTSQRTRSSHAFFHTARGRRRHQAPSFLLFLSCFFRFSNPKNWIFIPSMEKEKTQSPNSSASGSSSNGVAAAAAGVPALIIPKPVPKSVDVNAFAITFIQADAGSFKQVVQMLTGSSETAAKHHNHHRLAPPPSPAKNGASVAAKATGPNKPAFKLYERRGSLKNLKMISPTIPSFAGANCSSPLGAAFSPRRQPEILSPSVLDQPSLTLSPVTPLIPDPFNRSPQPNPPPAAAMSAEERAIAEKGFYLHPSPRDAVPPMLLSLFPVTSPTALAASAASSSS